jgi:all-trans-retinol 13,14-reductase
VSRSERRWDVIVVGSGLGGLTTAAYLQTNGLRTLVLEQYDVLGGCSHVFRRKRKFEFDVGLHYIGECGPGGTFQTVLGGLGLRDRIEFLEMDRDGFDTLIFPGFEFRVPQGWDRYLARLLELFPEDRVALERCVGVLGAVSAEISKARVLSPDAVSSYAAQAPTVIKWGLRSLGELYEECGLGLGARAVIAGQSGDHAAPPSRVSVGMHASLLNHFIVDGAYYPKGGGQVFAAHLVDVITAHGGEVRTRARVQRILMDEGAATGVQLVDGETLRAPIVVSNADVKRTFTELLERPQRSAMSERVAAYRMALPLFSLYLGLDIDLREHMPTTNYWCHPDLDPDAVYDAAQAGEMPENPWLYITSSSVKDPHSKHLAPDGHSSLQVLTVVPPGYDFWGIQEGPAAGERYSRSPAYKTAKRRVEETVMAKATEILPVIDGHVVWQESATPITQERYTLSSDGACYGIEHSTDQSGPLRASIETDIEGLFLVGASTVSGHGIVGAMQGGVAAAGAVLGRDLGNEIRNGRVYADPKRLTAGGDGWDPLRACKGHSRKPRSTRRELAASQA